MNQANGGGPNPAALQLQQGTDANIRQAMALGQSTPGQSNLAAARNIQDNTANAQQQAVSQAAIMRQQQQLNAQGQLGGLLGQQRGQDLNYLGQNQGNALNWAGLQNQASNQQLQGNIAQQQIQQQAYQNTAKASQQLSGQAIQGAAMAAGLAHGGEVPHYAGGGGVGLGFFGIGQPLADNSEAKKLDFTKPSAGSDGYSSTTGGTGTDTTGSSAFVSGLANQSLRPCPPWLTAESWRCLWAAESQGKRVCPETSDSNDTVKAMLSPGEIVLPKSVTESPEAAEKAKLFVQAIKAKSAAAKMRKAA